MLPTSVGSALTSEPHLLCRKLNENKLLSKRKKYAHVHQLKCSPFAVSPWQRLSGTGGTTTRSMSDLQMHLNTMRALQVGAGQQQVPDMQDQFASGECHVWHRGNLHVCGAHRIAFDCLSHCYAGRLHASVLKYQRATIAVRPAAAGGQILPGVRLQQGHLRNLWQANPGHSQLQAEHHLTGGQWQDAT